MSDLLLRSPNWLGDAVMATVMLPTLRQGSAGARLGVIVPQALADVFRAHPDVDEVLPFAPREEIRVYRAAGYERVVLAPVSFGSAWRALRGGVHQRYGYAVGPRRVLLRRHLPAHAYRRDRHQVENYRDLADLVGPRAADGAPAVHRLPAWEERAAELWPAIGKPRIAIQPGATYGPAKRWPAERFAAVADSWRERGATVGLLGGPADQPHVDAVSQAMRGEPVDLCGRTTVGELAALLATADLLVTNDTGPMHLAAAVGTPVAAIFGSTDPQWTGPWGRGHRVLSEEADCAPCFQRTCQIGYVCLTRVTVERAVAETTAMHQESS